MQRLVVTCCWRIFHAHLLYSTASRAWTIPFVFINSYAASIAKHWAALGFGQSHPSSTAFRIAILASLNSKSQTQPTTTKRPPDGMAEGWCTQHTISTKRVPIDLQKTNGNQRNSLRQPPGKGATNHQTMQLLCQEASKTPHS